MGVSMGIQHVASGEYAVVEIATLRGFRSGWLPVAERLGLVMVAQFADGALGAGVVPWQVPLIVAEVERLRQWCAGDPDYAWMAEVCGDILAAFARTNPAEYDFG